MRDAIRNRLISQIADIGDRCLEPHAADKDTQKPYLVIQQGDDTEDTIWTGFRRIIEIWPNVKHTKFKNVDNLCNQVINALHNQLLTTDTGEIFTCIYIGTAGNDTVDKDWDILTRGLRFSILALQPVNVVETVANDPWLDTLQRWSASLLGESWYIYLNKWPLGYRRPAVLWRLNQIDVKSTNMANFEVKKKITGHVIGLTPNQEVLGITGLIQGFGHDIKILLDAADRRYLTVSNPTGNFTADAFKTGQISLVLSRLTNKPMQEVPDIGKVIINGEVN